MRLLQHFENFAAGHFRKHGRNVLVACKAYLDGAQVGCLAGNGVQDVDEGDTSCSLKFKTSLKRLFEELLKELAAKGADCGKFVPEKEVKHFAAASTSTSRAASEKEVKHFAAASTSTSRAARVNAARARLLGK